MGTNNKFNYSIGGINLTNVKQEKDLSIFNRYKLCLLF